MRFIDEHRDRFAVALLLRVLNIAASTYYQWVRAAEQPCDRDLVDLGLLSTSTRSGKHPGTPTAPTGSTGGYAVTAFRSVANAWNG